MPVVAIIDGVRIELYYNDHGEPHFHAVAGGQKMRVRIGDASVIDGRIDPNKRRAVQEWTDRRRPELLTAWTRCRAKLRPDKIDP